ncbi:MAG TPA: carbohydrate binding domain-containing protein [Chthoniobacterales bacterium]
MNRPTPQNPSMCARVLLASLLISGSLFANILPAGTFELTEVRGQPQFDGWNVSPGFDAEGVSAIGRVTPGISPKGTGSLVLEFQKGGVYRVSPAARIDTIPINPGQKYRLSFQVKAEGGPINLEALIVEADALKKTTPAAVNSVETTAEWKSQSVEWQAGADKQFMSFTLQFGGKAPGTAQLADVSIEEI